MSQIVTRFAPSPTGRLHLGHAWSALQAHDFARERQGAFLLRIEDIDAGRSRPEHVDGIIEDLMWLGLDWDDEILYQSARLALYAEALDRLKAAGLAYPCFCTRADIAASASAPHGSDGLLYLGTCRHLGDAERAARMAREPHSWRLDMQKAVSGKLEWEDSTAGPIVATPHAFGDVVLARKDAPVSYHLAVTLDDAAQGVTDIVRGRDLFAATHVHRLLQHLLDLPTPLYHHHALLTDTDGDRLAKRHGAPTIADLRADGVDPVSLVTELRTGRLPAGYSLASA